MTDKTKKILILDDQLQWRVALSALLKGEGYIIFEAENLDVAKKIILDNTIDLVTIDLRLIDADSYDVGGLDFLYTVKKNQPKIATIILTGYPEAIKNEEALKTLNTVIIRKVPENSTFDIQYFIQTVNNLLEKQ